MPSFDRVYASSPVLSMPLQAAHQASLGKPFLQYQANPFSQPASWRAHHIRGSSVAGRKRSRDEASVNLDPPEKLVEPPTTKEPEDEWVYGPGMTLIKKSASYTADATSQSGTWVEEQAAKEEARKAQAALLAQEQLAQSRPSLRSHKSQRLDMTGSANTDELFPSRRSSPTRDAANPMTTPSDSLAQPIVDNFTVHLGIGWNRISEDSRIQAAARGWARYIENHYPVTHAKILLESRGLQSYLVEATEGYYLFAENLRQGRLVSVTADGALQNLKSSPPVFEGLDTMAASEPSKPLESVAAAAAVSAEMDMS